MDSSRWKTIGDDGEAFAADDPYEKPEKMLTEIMCGVPKSESRVIANEEDAARWDRYVASIAKIPKGGIVEYDISAFEDIEQYDE